MPEIAKIEGPYVGENSYLIADEAGGLTVIDPGMGVAQAAEEMMRERGWHLEQVILTHAHIDHCRDAAELADPHGVTVWVHPADEVMLDGAVWVDQPLGTVFEAAGMRVPASVGHLEHGTTVTIGGEAFQVRHAPGHSPGSVLLVGNAFCLSGDVLFAGAVGRTDLPLSDPEAMQRSLREQVATMDPELHILPGHGPATQLAEELRTNRWLIEACQQTQHTEA